MNAHNNATISMQTSLNTLFEIFKEQNRFIDLTPAIPLLYGYEDESLGTILVKLGVYKSTKQMRQELQPYAFAEPAILSVVVPESSTRYRDVHTWLFTKSRSIALIKIAARGLGIKKFASVSTLTEELAEHRARDLSKQNTERALSTNSTDPLTPVSGLYSMVTYLYDSVIDALNENLNNNTNINYCMLMIASLRALDAYDICESQLLSCIARYREPKEMYRRLLSRSDFAKITSELEIDCKFGLTHSDLGVELNAKLPIISTAHNLLVDNGDLFCRLVADPRSAYGHSIKASTDFISVELDEIHSKLRLEDGKSLVEDAIKNYVSACSVLPINALASVIRSVLSLESKEVENLGDYDGQVQELALAGKYAELSVLASKLAELKENACQTYIEMAEHITNSYKGKEFVNAGTKLDDEENNEVLEALSEKLKRVQDSLETEQAVSKELRGLVEVLVADKVAENKVYSTQALNLFSGTGSVLDVLNLITEIFPTVVVSALALEGATNSQYTKTDKLFTALYALCGSYLEAINSGQPDSVAMKLLPNYRANESESTMKNYEFGRMRLFDFPDQENLVELQQHITLGVRRSPTTTIQIFFGIIEGVVHIGYIGGHLPVSSS